MEWEQVTLVKFTTPGEILGDLKQVPPLAEVVGDSSEEDWKDPGYRRGKMVANLGKFLPPNNLFTDLIMVLPEATMFMTEFFFKTHRLSINRRLSSSLQGHFKAVFNAYIRME